MDDHWSAFANKPQWKIWLFLAELATSDGLGGVMFDGDIDEPGGVDSQGSAVFTKSPHFHTINGDYIKANPPEAEAIQRELFFNTIHESGHALNLYHSFSKLGGTPWEAPTWMPVHEDDEALSWMNYPEAPSPGYNATWFYDRFRFRFDDNENLFLRHAPARFVQMGNEAWGQNHSRVARSTLDRRLSLVVRTQKSIFTLGEPINVELRLRNISDQAVMAHRNLDPSDGFVEIGFITPSGQRMPFVPFIQTRIAGDQGILEPNDSVYQTVNLTIGKLGFPSKTPDVYRIEASYHNVDAGLRLL